MKIKHILHFVKYKMLFIGCQLFFDFFKKMLIFLVFPRAIHGRKLHRYKFKIEIYSLF